MEKQNDCVNSSLVNYYHRLGFMCTEALCVSRSHFRLFMDPQKSFSKKSPIFKPADTLPVSCNYKQKEFWVKNRLWCLVLFAGVQTPALTSCLTIHINDTRKNIHTVRTGFNPWSQLEAAHLSQLFLQICRHPGPPCMGSIKIIWKLGSQCLVPHYTLYRYHFIPFCTSLENEDPPNTEPGKLFSIKTPKCFTVLPSLS